MFLKQMTLLLLAVILLNMALPTLSYSETTPAKPLEGILLKPLEVKKLNKKLEYCLQTEKLTTVLEAEKAELLTQIDLKETKINNLKLNVDEFKKETAGFKAAYLEKNDQLNKLQESVPSRMTWFGIGAGTIGVIAIALSILIAR